MQQQNHTQALQAKRNRVESALKNPDVDEETRRDAREELAGIEYDIDLLLDGGEDILMAVLRSEEVCLCHRPMCALKKGEIPPSVEYYDGSLLSALRAFERRHRGANVVKKYREARAAKHRTVNETLDGLLNRVTANE